MAYQDAGAAALHRRGGMPDCGPFGPSGDLTRNENIVYKELLECSTPAKAYELLERLSDHGLRAPMTIYRALDSLIQKGFAKKVVSLNAFIAIRPDSESEISAFMTCRICKQTMRVDISRTDVEAMFGDIPLTLQEIFIEANGECGMEHCNRNVVCNG